MTKEEAIEVYKELINPRIKEAFETFVHELAESEDEKTKKEIVTYLKSVIASKGYRDKIIESWIAWLEKQGDTFTKKDVDDAYLKGISDAKHELEKQGEHAKFRDSIQVGDKVTRNQDGVLVNLSQLKRVAKKDEKQGEQKPADKVELKFHEGDWVVSPNGVYWHIDKISNNRYEVTSNTGESSDWNLDTNIYHKFTIQDAKDGDVLYLQKDGKEHIIIYKGVIKEKFRTFVSAYCAYNGIVDAFCFADVSKYVDIVYGGIMPATKEQRDLLFQKMNEAGYEWDANKRELKEIEQKPAWSEEDMKMVESIITDIKYCKKAYNNYSYHQNEIGWLKSLKDRVQPKQEWSMYDETILKTLIDHFEYKKEFNEAEDYDIVLWLKSLRPQNTWKPSDEQMDTLETAVSSLQSTALESLYQDLKRL